MVVISLATQYGPAECAKRLNKPPRFWGNAYYSNRFFATGRQKFLKLPAGAVWGGEAPPAKFLRRRFGRFRRRFGRFRCRFCCFRTFVPVKVAL